ncbi:hypothetical protein Tco_0054057 [Tanacetum coccineum]
MAPMALSDPEVKNCSKTCLKNHETLKTQYDKLRIEFNKSKSDLYNYKRGLASVEERLVFYKKNEGMLYDQIDVLKSNASFNEAEIITLKKIIEKLKKEKEDNLLKINNYDNATKSLDKLIGSQLIDNNKKGLGYNVVPPPLTGLFAPPIIDLSHSSIEKFKEPKFVGYGVKESDSDDEDDKPKPKVVKKTVNSKTVIQDVVTDGQIKKNQLGKQLGSDFVMIKKACYVCGSFEHLQYTCKHKRYVNDQKQVKPVWNNSKRVNHHYSTRITHLNPKRNCVPKAVLMKTGMRLVNAAKPKAAYNAVKRNMFNAVKASSC